MLSRYDDYPIHQTPAPVAHPASSDRNVYDRYWFNGYDRDATFYFGVAMGLYPNRGILDGAFSLVRDGVEHCFFGSRRAPGDPAETAVGPLRIEVQDPMRRAHVVLKPNDTGLECDLVFSARTAGIEEGRQTRTNGFRPVYDVTRFAQLGRWRGTIRCDGQEMRIDETRVLGTKDRSWGIRQVGEPEAGGAPNQNVPQFFFMWAPLHFDDCCTHFGVFEDELGRPWHQDGAIAPAYPAPDAIPTHQATDPLTVTMRSVEHQVVYRPGTRWADTCRIRLHEPEGATHEIELEALLRFQMKGIGYGHPTWGHGRWHGELETGGESFKLDDLNPLSPDNLHVQQVCRARYGERVGVGVLEQICIGPHQPSGFKSLLDGASPS